jgi:hypothetical protein
MSPRDNVKTSATETADRAPMAKVNKSRTIMELDGNKCKELDCRGYKPDTRRFVV